MTYSVDQHAARRAPLQNEQQGYGVWAVRPRTVQEFCPVGDPFSTRTVCSLAKSLHVEETLVPMSEKFGGSLAKPTVPGDGSR